MMVDEARLVEAPGGLVPEGDGWFVVDARQARWYEHEAFGRYTTFEGEHRFEELGVNIHVLLPGKPSAMYHGEEVQEDFLVLSGECLLIVDGEERRLSAWDFVHCPPWTEHIFVGAGDGPCAVLMIGGRRPDIGIRYPVSEVAAAHGASVQAETALPAEAYAGLPRPVPAPYRAGDLPGA